MSTAKLLYVVGRNLLGELGSAIGGDLTLGKTVSRVETKVFAYIGDGTSVYGQADNDILRLIAIAELQLESVRTKFMNLKNVDPKGAAFLIAFSGVLSGRDVAEESRALLEKRTDLLKRLIAHTKGLKTFGKVLLGAKGAMGGVSSQLAFNAIGAERLNEVCDRNIATYERMIKRRKVLLTEISPLQRLAR